MDSDQENMLANGSYQDDDTPEGSDIPEKSSEEIEKMKRSPSELYEVGDKTKGDEGTGEQKPAPPALIRKCEFCGKEFTSGKALGGHKRFHLQAQRKLERATTTNKANCDATKLSSFMPNGKLKLSCYLCNKDFPSEKSLFGHMRSHPDRDWRGVHPPTIPSDKHSPCSSNFDSMEQNKDDNNYFSAAGAAAPNEPATDISRSLPTSWKKTNKRGRECVFDGEVVGAAETLMALSRDSWPRAEFPELQNLSEEEEDQEEEEEDDNWSREEYSCEKNMKGSLNNMTNEVTPGRVQDHGTDFDEKKVTMKKKKKKNKKIKKKLILKLKNRYSESAEEEDLLIKTLKMTQDVYKCDICDKSFSTFQALGGHKSGHSKEKNNNSMDEEGSPPDDDDDDAGEPSQSDPKTRLIDLNEPYVMQDEENNPTDHA